jgi:antitoxin ParD1/3/4
MELTLDAESEQIVRRHIESGKYPSPGDVVSEALRLLEALDEPEHDELRREMANGLAEADRGELIDGAEVFTKLRGRLGIDGTAR